MATTLDHQATKTIAAWLRSERAKRGVTQRAIAQELGITDKAPQNWEAARTMPTADRLMRVAIVFGFSVVALAKMIEQLGAETQASGHRK